MENKYIGKTVLFSGIILLLSGMANAQAFKRGSFVVNLSEGSTNAKYSTSVGVHTLESENGGTGEIVGARDPLTIEYGLSNRWGIGSSWGTDFYYLNPAAYYGFHVSGNKVKATTDEYTINGSYHFFVSKRIDLAAVTSFGTLSVALKGADNDFSYQYKASGAIFRLGLHARYYVYKRIGILAMLTTYTSSCSTQGIKGNTVGSGYSTGISGNAVEFGLCYRVTR
ncbi:MAG TPA: hypothetical protein VGO45_07860 [Bacteroidia bacterium]|jgi:hypothetical protein|nr:hypothetical protein [Bacteroidia bacterium]